MKNINKFQKNIGKLADYRPLEVDGFLEASWVVEEAAEVLKIFKTATKNGKELDDKDMKNLEIEMGDVLTALSNLANSKGIKLKNLLEPAQDKLAERTGKSLDD